MSKFVPASTNDLPSCSNSCNDSTPITQEKMSLDNLLSKQKVNSGKEGLGFGSKANNKRKSKKKKVVPAPPQEDTANVNEGEKAKDKGKAAMIQAGKSGPSRPETLVPQAGESNSDNASSFNPLYVLCRNYYGDVCAKYVGPYDGYIEWSIWVPKTLVTNMRGPMKTWGPKNQN